MRSHATRRPTSRNPKLLLSLAAALALALILRVDPAAAATPTVTIDPSPSASYTTAQPSGQINPNGGALDGEGNPVPIAYYFEYREAGAEGWPSYVFGGEITGSEAESSAPISVEGNISNLKPGQEYEVRLTAVFEGVEYSSPEPNAAFTTNAVTPPTVTIEPPSEVEGESAHLEGTVDPEGTDQAFRAFCRFLYVTDAKFQEDGFAQAKSIGCNQDPVTGEDPVPVEADLLELDPNTLYHVRISATNKGGESTADESFSTEVLPPTVTFATTSATETTAMLRATVDPQNTPTTYRFEFGPTTAYGTTVTGTETLNGPNPLVVSHKAKGLAPKTTYHFRVIAEGAETVVGADQTVTTGPFDQRAYEMVSPVEKNGADIEPNSWRTRSSDDGNAVGYVSLGIFADAEGAGVSTEYIARRGADGWVTHGITPPQSRAAALGTGGEELTFLAGEASGDLSTGVYQSWSAVTPFANNENIANLYLREDLDQGPPYEYTLLNPSPTPIPLNAGDGDPHIFFAAASEDFSHVLFQSERNLLPGAFGPYPKLYEWADGELRLAGILPNDEVAELSVAGAYAPNITFPYEARNLARNAISDDGSRVFFTVMEPGEVSTAGFQSGTLFMRVDGTSTVQINTSEKTVPDAPQPAHFDDATPDGEHVFFTTAEQLVDEDTDSGPSLYRYDVSAPEGERLSLLVTLNAGEGDHKGGPTFAISDDGSYVYFRTSRELADAPKDPPGPNLEGLYVWHNDNVRYIARSYNDYSGNSQVSITQNIAQISDDGSTVLFPMKSDQTLTGFDNRCAFNSNDEGCVQLYTYRYAPDELACASCEVDGKSPTSNAFFSGAYFDGIDGSQPLGRGPIRQRQSHSLSRDGRRVFFTSPERLVPEDTNGRYDPYEYEIATHQVRLISTGQSGTDSWFAEASPDGEDVFFTTREKLVGIDRDGAGDLYDARVGGGIAAQNPVFPTECQGDACVVAPVAPNDASPASATFKGPGNQGSRAKARRCAKGKRKVRRNGKARCVKKAKSKAGRGK